jgi:hypothetical protein
MLAAINAIRHNLSDTTLTCFLEVAEGVQVLVAVGLRDHAAERVVPSRPNPSGREALSSSGRGQ